MIGEQGKRGTRENLSSVRFVILPLDLLALMQGILYWSNCLFFTSNLQNIQFEYISSFLFVSKYLTSLLFRWRTLRLYTSPSRDIGWFRGERLVSNLGRRLRSRLNQEKLTIGRNVLFIFQPNNSLLTIHNQPSLFLPLLSTSQARSTCK